MWNDTSCTVEDEYTSPSPVHTLNHTCQFRNTLTTDKGDITTARSLQIKNIASFEDKFVKRNSSDESDFSDDEESNDFVVSVTIKKQQRKLSEGTQITQPLRMSSKHSSGKIKRNWELV